MRWRSCGADLDASASPDGFAVRLSVPTTHLGAGLTLMADAIRRPDFIESEFEHEQRLRLQEIDQARAYPQHVAVELLNAALVRQISARPVRPAATRRASRRSLEPTSQDVRSHATSRPPWRRSSWPATSATGDPLAEVEAAFGDWRGDVPAIDRLSAPVGLRSAVGALGRLAGRTASDVAGGRRRASRARIRAGRHCSSPTSRSGGTFSSRINTVLREQKGVTYGASSSLDTARGAGLVTVSTAVRTDATAEAVADIVDILARPAPAA